MKGTTLKGNPIPNVTVPCSGAGARAVRTADQNGNCSVIDLAADSFTVTATMGGLHTIQVPGVRIGG